MRRTSRRGGLYVMTGGPSRWGASTLLNSPEVWGARIQMSCLM
jgi:hypothetical protein